MFPAMSDGLAALTEHPAGLARKRMAAGVLFRDESGRVLLVEPSYKPLAARSSRCWLTASPQHCRA